jgi:hypothetical protein
VWGYGPEMDVSKGGRKKNRKRALEVMLDKRFLGPNKKKKKNVGVSMK